jgi:hypothetical protein
MKRSTDEQQLQALLEVMVGILFCRIRLEDGSEHFLVEYDFEKKRLKPKRELLKAIKAKEVSK